MHVRQLLDEIDRLQAESERQQAQLSRLVEMTSRVYGKGYKAGYDAARRGGQFRPGTANRGPVRGRPRQHEVVA